jgi:hypothetical protein
MGEFMQGIPEDVSKALFLNCVLPGMRLQEPLAIQSVLKFVKVFVSMGYDGSPLEMYVKNILGLIGAELVKQLIKSCCELNTSMLPKCGQTLLQLFQSFPVETQQLLIVCLREEGFPSFKVGQKDKETFVKKLVGTRKLKDFNEAIKLFSIKSR